MWIFDLSHRDANLRTRAILADVFTLSIQIKGAERSHSASPGEFFRRLDATVASKLQLICFWFYIEFKDLRILFANKVSTLPWEWSCRSVRAEPYLNARLRFLNGDSQHDLA